MATPLTATGATYRDLLLQLLPPGIGIPRDSDSRLYQVLHAIGDELARAHNRLLDVFTEMDPRTTNPAEASISDTGFGGALEDWERVLGLPDPCSDTPLSEMTVAERRRAVASKLIAQGGVTPAYFIQIAAALGYTITIDEPLEAFRCDGPGCDAPLYNETWAFTFIVHATYDDEEYFRCDGPGCDAPLVDYGTDQLICLLEALKPAHTTIHWAFTAAGP